jgi:hypothetical protein
MQMNSNSQYPNLDLLFGGYLNQDSELWGDTIEKIVTCYKNGINPDMRQAVLLEIDDFRRTYVDDLDAAFEAAYGYDFGPELWGYTTTASFLDDLKKLLQK